MHRDPGGGASIIIESSSIDPRSIRPTNRLIETRLPPAPTPAVSTTFKAALPPGSRRSIPSHSPKQKHLPAAHGTRAGGAAEGRQGLLLQAAHEGAARHVCWWEGFERGGQCACVHVWSVGRSVDRSVPRCLRARGWANPVCAGALTRRGPAAVAAASIPPVSTPPTNAHPRPISGHRFDSRTCAWAHLHTRPRIEGWDGRGKREEK